MIRADSIREAENIANVEIDKIATWAENNKTRFNEEKSKVMLMTRRKRKEQKEVAVYRRQQDRKGSRLRHSLFRIRATY